MQRRRDLTMLVALAVSACGDDGSKTTEASTAPMTMTATNMMSTGNPSTSDTQSGSSGSATDATSGPTTGTSAADGGPIFLSFNTSVMTLTDGESVTFTAILTDPDGVEDIVGGSLQSADESLEFGPFVAAGQPGTYSISLSWAQIHQTDPIEFDGGELPRSFRAVFFDQGAHKATDDVELKLACPGGAACAGACTDLALDGLNCGACGRVCDGGEDACESGACLPTYGSCVSYGDGPETCAEICQISGETCVALGCDGDSTAMFFDHLNDCEDNATPSYDELACDEVHQWVPGAMSIRCCCTDTK